MLIFITSKHILGFKLLYVLATIVFESWKLINTAASSCIWCSIASFMSCHHVSSTVWMTSFRVLTITPSKRRGLCCAVVCCAVLCNLSWDVSWDVSSAVCHCAAPILPLCSSALVSCRQPLPYRPVEDRLQDYGEVLGRLPQQDQEELLHTQAARCMDCGTPFCHQTSSGQSCNFPALSHQLLGGFHTTEDSMLQVSCAALALDLLSTIFWS